MSIQETDQLYFIVFLMTFLSGLFIALLFIWNKKSIAQKNRLQEIQNEKNKQLLQASIDGQEIERKRIAENLHDDLGPMLSALKLQINSGSLEEGTIEDINQTLNQTVNSLRDISHRMSPAVLQELGLAKALKHTFQKIGKYSDITFHYSWSDDIEAFLPYKYQINIYRVIREALNNILKHSEASVVEIRGQLMDDSKIEITIADNGKGFEYNPDARIKGLGIKSIKARIEAMSGHLDIQSGDQGTTLLIDIDKQNLQDD